MSPSSFGSVRKIPNPDSSLGVYSYGYDTGYISGVKEMDGWLEIFGDLQPDGRYRISSGTNSLVTSILSAGTFVGMDHIAVYHCSRETS